MRHFCVDVGSETVLVSCPHCGWREVVTEEGEGRRILLRHADIKHGVEATATRAALHIWFKRKAATA